MNDFVGDAVSLHPDVRDIQYKETRSFRQLSERLRKHYTLTGYVLAGGFFLLLAGSETRHTLYPLTVHDVIYIDHDRSTGWIGQAVAAHDAPATFGVKEAQAALNAYVWARERYVPQIEQVNEAQVKAMSSIDVFADYTAWLKKASPKQQYGAEGGHVDVFNVTFSKPLASPDGITISYAIQYDRRAVTAGDTVQARCETTAAFQWHPEMIQDEAAARLNPAGLEVISYHTPVCK